MSKNKIEAIRRLIAHTSCETEILQFMIDNEIVTEDDIVDNIISKTNVPEFIHNALSDSDKVTLYSIRWTVLPQEYIDLSISTTRDYKEFSYDQQ